MTEQQEQSLFEHWKWLWIEAEYHELEDLIREMIKCGQLKTSKILIETIKLDYPRLYTHFNDLINE